MVKNKILRLLLTIVMLVSMLSGGVLAVNGDSIPQLGEQQAVEITWVRTSEPYGAKNLGVASWSFGDVSDINYDKTDNVWDGGTVGNYYIGNYRREWDIATWHTNRSYWNGTCDVRRFRGEFKIPDGYTVFDDIKLASVGDYTSLGLEDIIAINDNIYVFVYPKDKEINDSNFLEYFAFWTGTACQEAAKAVNGGKPITFHGILGTTPRDYKDVIGSPIPQENLLSHTDGWYCEAAQDNVGYILKNSPDDSEFVIDIFVEDFAEDGGMDRMNLIFTKTTEPSENNVLEETIAPEESELTEETIVPEESELTEETTVAEESELTEETTVPEESELIEESIVPEESGLTEETTVPEESELIEETTVPKETETSKIPTLTDKILPTERVTEQIEIETEIETETHNPPLIDLENIILVKDDADDNMYYVLDDNENPLGHIILPDEVNIDEVDIIENLISLSGGISSAKPESSTADNINTTSDYTTDDITSDNVASGTADAENHYNPKTSDSCNNFMILGLILGFLGGILYQKRRFSNK